MRFYNKYRNGIFTEADYSMPIIHKFGTGGGNTPLVLSDDCDGISTGTRRNYPGGGCRH